MLKRCFLVTGNLDGIFSTAAPANGVNGSRGEWDSNDDGCDGALVIRFFFCTFVKVFWRFPLQRFSPAGHSIVEVKGHVRQLIL